MAAGKSRSTQGGGELSGLLRHAEKLQQELERAIAELRQETIRGKDATGRIEIQASGDGQVQAVKIDLENLSKEDRKRIEEGVLVATQKVLEQVLTRRREKASGVTRGLQIPELFL